ncbi:MAG: sodium-dependent transporter [Wenzhouxiangellaceae bacterium]|nr:sodium-dependent transporter [Wenzhouxiangellaceae bacterium]
MSAAGRGQAPIRFSGRVGMLLTMIGLAVGLGNVWRFPYMMGSYGGSAFLLVYLAFTLLLAVPVLSAEWALGRATGRGPPGAYRAVLGPRAGWLIGGLLLITVLVADAYYLVVIGQILITAGWSLGPGFAEGRVADFAGTLGSGALQFAVAAGLLVLSLWIIERGLKRGIEAASRWIVPGFAVVMAWLIVVALNLPGASGALADFLEPDFAALGAGDVFAALGQAFFSLGLGGTFHVVYGSYLDRRGPLVGNAVLAAAGDAGAALLASLFIVPTALVFALDLAQGPGLIFDTLPRLFAQLPGGGWPGGIFLLALTAVALLSNVAALEVARAAFARRWPGRDRQILFALLAIELALIAPVAFDNDLIAVLDLVFGSGMQLLGGLAAVIALGWGLGTTAAARAIFGEQLPAPARLYVRWLRWVVPLGLLAVLAGWLEAIS